MNLSGNEATSATMRAIVALLTSSDDLPANRRRELLLLLTTTGGEKYSKVPDSVLTIAETADALRKTKRTVLRLCAQGHLTRIRFPGRNRGAGILASSVSALLEKSSSQVVS